MTLIQRLQQEGHLEVVGGNTPFVLDDPGQVWYIEEGHVEVFSVQVRDGRTQGSRYHFFSAPEGSLLMGMDLPRYGLGRGFLAVGLVGTRLRRLSLKRFRTLAADPAHTVMATALVDSWVQGLSYGIAKDINPRTDETLEPGTSVTLVDGCKVRSRKGVVWLDATAGSSVFIGMEPVSLVDEPVLLPLTQDTWLQTVDDAAFDVYGTAAVIMHDPCWRGLDRLYQLLLSCEFFNTRLLAVDEFNRLQTKAEYSQQAVHQALTQMASVIDAQPSLFADVSMDDALIGACQLVGNALSLSIRPPAEMGKDLPFKSRLERIARSSHFRTREVVLKGTWWTQDNGPMLALIEEGQKPVALIPTAPGHYTLHHPQHQTTQPLTPALAATLYPLAYVFYRPLPSHKLKITDLLRFGRFGLKKDLLMVLWVGLAGGLLGIATPIATGVIFDTVIPGANRSQLLELTIGLVVMALAGSVFHYTQQVAMLRVEGRMGGDLHAALWDRLLNLPVPFFRQFSTGDLTARANGIHAIRIALSESAIASLLSCIFAVFNFALLFYYSAQLALIATLLTGIALGVLVLASQRQLKVQHQIAHLEGLLSDRILQLITGISKLRVAGAEAHAFALWARDFAKQRRLLFKAGSVTNVYQVFDASFMVITSMVVFAAVVVLEQNSFTTGSFLAFFAAFGIFMSAVLSMGDAFTEVLSVIPTYQRIKPILETVPEVDEVKADPGTLSGDIEVSHISYRYTENGPLVLDDVSLRIRPGEFAAIVGPSGSGKSTLFRLLLGFDVPETGAILYDGQDYAGLDRMAVRRQVGVVLQHSAVMPGDLYSNIVGARPLTLEDAWAAAERAGMAADIEAMPMGMHTVVGVGGSTFSGGQRQRLMIARAVAANPRILFFDEATSALDNRTQAIVSENLEQLQATRVVIAHRLSTIRNADCIYVIDKGKLVEYGNFEALMAHDGIFAEMARDKWISPDVPMPTQTQTFRNDLAELAQLAVFVETFVTDHRLDEGITFELNVSLDELMTNVISYAFTDNKPHHIEVSLTVSGPRLIAVIQDDGVPFDPTDTPPPEALTPGTIYRIGGLGIHLVRQIMDEVTYERSVNRNITTLGKILTPIAQADEPIRPVLLY